MTNEKKDIDEQKSVFIRNVLLLFVCWIYSISFCQHKRLQSDEKCAQYLCKCDSFLLFTLSCWSLSLLLSIHLSFFQFFILDRLFRVWVVGAMSMCVRAISLGIVLRSKYALYLHKRAVLNYKTGKPTKILHYYAYVHSVKQLGPCAFQEYITLASMR